MWRAKKGLSRNPMINTALTHFNYTKKSTIITQIYRANGYESNEYVFLSKQIKKYRRAIKQSMHKNAKHNTRILKKFNMSLQARGNITTRWLGYKTQKLHHRVSESVGRSADDVCLPTGNKQLSRTSTMSQQAAEVGISGIKGCSLHQDFHVTTRNY